MKNIKFIICLFVLILLYSGFIYTTASKEDNGKSPVFTIDENVLTLSVLDNEFRLLEDIKVIDEEDGDLTSKVVIDNISKFDENNDKAALSLTKLPEKTVVYEISGPMFFGAADKFLELLNASKDVLSSSITASSVLCFCSAILSSLSITAFFSAN